WARVATPAPAPLPASVVSVRGQDLVPLAGALALAALASLAAVIATRRLARRPAGLLMAAVGAGAALAGGLSPAAPPGLGPGRGAGGGRPRGGVRRPAAVPRVFRRGPCPAAARHRGSPPRVTSR